ncbi:helix-turn-helix domain-containing protein [Pseudomonas sp. C27(2019)]|uniref:AlbA family DNA-binding domain-containing protein n=1 Tax=Pseudomonas sp. C27(2019) TaxID=2604941 RepID=UPI002113AA46|nr:ATP-binding protein [Pseudomonas sp. C27(2019)]
MTDKVDAVPVALPSVESLTVEFKSDRNGYPDRELIEALTCLANTLGGELWLGVEDDGTPSGLHRKHSNTAHLAALIASQTHPSLTVTIRTYTINNVAVAKIIVPQSDTLVATNEGAYLQRRLKTDNTPECIHLTF